MSSSASEVVSTTTGMSVSSEFVLELGQHLAAVAAREVQVRQDQPGLPARPRPTGRIASRVLGYESGIPAEPLRPR